MLMVSGQWLATAHACVVAPQLRAGVITRRHGQIHMGSTLEFRVITRSDRAIARVWIGAVHVSSTATL